MGNGNQPNERSIVCEVEHHFGYERGGRSIYARHECCGRRVRAATHRHFDQSFLPVIGRRHGVTEILGWQFSGLIAWCLWRAIYLSKLPGLQKKVRVAIDWMLDLIFSKDLVQLPTLRSVSISEAESSSTGTDGSSKTEIRNQKPEGAARSDERRPV